MIEIVLSRRRISPTSYRICSAIRLPPEKSWLNIKVHSPPFCKRQSTLTFLYLALSMHLNSEI